MKVTSPVYVLPLPRDLQLYTQAFLQHPVTETRKYRAAMVTKMLAFRAQRTAQELKWCHPAQDKGVFCTEAMAEIKQYIEKNPDQVCGACRFYERHRILFYPRSVQRFFFPFSLRQKLLKL